jgi:excinuclease UvrABC helicase subunit UvrB
MDKSVNSEADDKSQKSNSENSVTEFDRSGKSMSELKTELTTAQTQFGNLEAKIEEAAESEEFDEADVLTDQGWKTYSIFN